MGGLEGGVDGGGGVGEAIEEGWVGEDVGDVLFTISERLVTRGVLVFSFPSWQYDFDEAW